MLFFNDMKIHLANVIPNISSLFYIKNNIRPTHTHTHTHTHTRARARARARAHA